MMKATAFEPGERIPGFLLNPENRIYRHILLQLVVILITMNLFWDTPDHFIFTSGRFVIWLAYFLVINGLIYFNRYYLAPRFLVKGKRTGYVIRSVGLILGAVLIIGILQSILSDMEESQRHISPVYGVIGLLSSVISVGFVVAGISASLIFSNWLISIRKLDELESVTLESELKFLKNQINPHFLFNTLNNANYLILDNRQEAAEVLSKLEDLLRFQVTDATREQVLLSADIHFLSDYLNLEKIRRDDFEFVITKEGDINAVSVPPFMFIPFVENAVKHSQDSESGSFIHLFFKVQDNRLEFLCENSKPSGIGNDNPEKVGGIGLENIRRRLDLLFPGRYKLEIEDEEIKYKVNLQLKL